VCEVSVCCYRSDHVVRRQMAAVKMELLELQCAEEKYSTLLGLVTEPVSRASTSRLPPAISDLSDFAFQVQFFHICLSAYLYWTVLPETRSFCSLWILLCHLMQEYRQ